MYTLFRKLISISLLLLFLSSCAYFKSIHNLKNVVVKDVFMVYDTSVLRVPGNRFGIGIGVLAKLKDSVTYPNDTLLFTKGFKGGSLNWSNFTVKTFGCNYANGKIQIPANVWPEKGNIAIDVEAKTQTDKRYYLSIPRNYLIQTKLFAQNVFKKAPSNVVRLGVIKKYDNNKIEILSKKRDVANYLSLCKIYVTGGVYDNSYFTITDDFYNIEYNEAGIIAEPIIAPTLVDTFRIQLDYIDDYQASFYASSSFQAPSGENGASGTNAQCYSCRGADGFDAGSGYNGHAGEDGHDVAVDVTTVFDSILKTNLCIFTVEDLITGERKHFKVNPNGGSLSVHTSGGQGGDGGDGGNGGNGGDGGDGETYVVEKKKSVSVTDSTGTHLVEIIEHVQVTNEGGHGGRGGCGGNGGFGGNGGRGGNIYVYYSEASFPYLHCIDVQTIGGNAGHAGLGGYAGRGGAGGKGDPSGKDGLSGFNGNDGRSGLSGNRGEIILEMKKNIANSSQ